MNKTTEIQRISVVLSILDKKDTARNSCNAMVFKVANILLRIENSGSILDGPEKTVQNTPANSNSVSFRYK